MRHRDWWIGAVVAAMGLWSITAFAAGDNRGVKFWMRGDEAYLAQGSAMPLWPELPSSALPLKKALVMTLELPKGFEITTWGESTAFAVNPLPLSVPTKMAKVEKGDKTVFQLSLPVPPDKGQVRPAFLVSVGENAAGDYPIVMGLKTADGAKVWPDAKATLHVLPPLAGKAPRRLQIAVFNYEGYTNSKFQKAIEDAVVKSGMNGIYNMRYWSAPNTIAQNLHKEKGFKRAWTMFWKREMVGPITSIYPEARQLDAKGQPIADELCYTWCFQNREKIVKLLADHLREKQVSKLYDIIINDNEERALTHDLKTPAGDVYTPITQESFRSQAKIPADVKLTPETIMKDYKEQWITFRCWQSAEMAEILAEAVKQVDPNLVYGYYSGYQYVGQYEGLSRYAYATDWPVLAEKNCLDVGMAGYYGSNKDLEATAKALGDVPYCPAEMYVENFLAAPQTLPDNKQFAYRLMRALMYGGSQYGVSMWYLQVYDAAAFDGTAKVSAVAAEIEDFLLDGKRCDAELMVTPATYDRDSIFGYQLGRRRLAVIFNHSAKEKSYQLRWKTAPIKPETVEIVSGRKLGNTAEMKGKLAPNSYAVFIMVSDGN